ncbi:MAG: response regulator [Rhodobacteraceae bacterium]|nr:response regulator [Paracoccaceae bacterium]
MTATGAPLKQDRADDRASDRAKDRASVQAYPHHVLVVDDDPRLCKLISKFLTGQGLMVTTAENAGEARRQLESLKFELLVVDRMMPGEDGISLIRSVRESSNVPILMLTAMGEPAQRIEGLEHGADDYMAKPFEPRELLLRINAILRRAPAADEPPRHELRFGDCRYDIVRHRLSRNGEAVPLTAGEAQLLAVLAEHANEPVDRAALGSHPDAETNPRTIDVQITRLRRKIEADSRQPRYLQTVRGTGYLLRTD